MGKRWRDMDRRERDGRASPKWKRTRAAVFAQYGDTCWMCGRPGADTVDHLVPLAEGGTNDMGNLRPAHGKRMPFCPGNFGRNGSRPQSPRSRAW